jgi:hypothetical protein
VELLKGHSIWVEKAINNKSILVEKIGTRLVPPKISVTKAKKLDPKL